jgi:hypothetical protein
MIDGVYGGGLHSQRCIKKRGSNTLEIRRAGRGDNFLIRGAMVHWREP